jgi:carboxymethylenebutenolidase
MSDFTDPMRASSRDLTRRAFTVISTSGAAFASSIAAALAAGTGFGQPHPPIVAEDDPAITVERPVIASGDRQLGAYYAAPRNAARAPGVVVVQAIWGTDAQLRDTVRRFAKEGYVAPFRDVAAKLVDATVDADLAATAGFLRAARPDMRVGVVGFCMGGSIALRQAVDDPTFAAASVFYGKVRYGTTGNAGPITPIALAYAERLTVPLVGSWGERDTSIVADDVRALDAALVKQKRAHDIKVYAEAGHAFFDDTRPTYVASAAADAWTRTLVWFGQHLK